METAYAQLCERFRKIRALERTADTLWWDAQTVMPSAGSAERGEQIAAVMEARTTLIADPEVAEWLEEARVDTESHRVNLYLMRRMWLHDASLPASLVGAFEKARATCCDAWRAAKPSGDFASVAPHLARLLGLVREIASIKADALKCTPYEALVDKYQPGLTTGFMNGLVEPLRAELPALLSHVIERQSGHGVLLPPLPGPFLRNQQKILCERVITAMGFDFSRGVLGESAHPFSLGNRNDARMTTRFDEENLFVALTGGIHEAGHAQYIQGLPFVWADLMISEPGGMGVHETQSLFWEKSACRTLEFAEFLSPIVYALFGGRPIDWQPNTILRHLQRVRRELIRTEADEVSYLLHIALRYNLEQALLGGSLAVNDLPGAWNEGMEELIGVRPENDREGCLQDIHWFDGMFGYFMCYLVGAMGAAMLYVAAMERRQSEWRMEWPDHCSELLRWLREHVHSKGGLLPMQDLMRRATGSDFSARSHLIYLRTRYLSEMA